MASYTFGPAPVLVETTGEFAIGATGVFRPLGGGDPVPVADLNNSPLPNILVGPKGAHGAFTADIPAGVLDFGSVLIPKVCDEAVTAAIDAREVAESARSTAETAAQAATSAALSASNLAAVLAGAVIVVHGEDGNHPRPATNRPVIWYGLVDPVNADDTLDVAIFLTEDATGDGALDISDIAGLVAALADKLDVATYTAGMAAKQDVATLRTATQAWHPVVLKASDGTYPARPASAVQAVFIGSPDPGAAALTGDEWIQI